MNGILIAVCLGWLGGYQFYKGNIIKGLLYLLTVGLFCVGWFIDIVHAVDEYKHPNRATGIKGKRSVTYPYIGNVETKVFHFTTCDTVFLTRNDRKYIRFANRIDALNKGYRPCNKCKP